jgi:cytochrome c biogenesis protein
LTAQTDPDQATRAGRPEDHFDQPSFASITSPRLGAGGWLRWTWRQLTSMRTALFLLLLLALAAVPGSLFPQRTSDPNGVAQYFKNDPEGARTLDALQLFTVYTSVWFSAVYLLLFLSVIGCVIPRTRTHWIALRQPPPRTPRNMRRLPAHELRTVQVSDARVQAEEAVRLAQTMLRTRHYRVRTYLERQPDGQEHSTSVSAERGYLRETGNLLFHVALIGILLTLAIGGGYAYAGQRVLVEGQTFVNTRSAYDSFTPGRFFTDSQLEPYSLSLDTFSVKYIEDDPSALGFITDYIATVKTQRQSDYRASVAEVRVNEPLSIESTEVYLLGNGYAPEVVVKNPDGDVVFNDTVPFLPQDTNLTSVGVVKVPDGLPAQVGMIGLFYPTQVTSTTGAFVSIYPDLKNPVLTFNVYTGDLGLSSGAPKSVYALDTSQMTQVAGRGAPSAAVELRPGETALLPNGLGSIEFVDTKRFASFDVTHDPTKGLMLFFAITVVASLAAAFFIPRRRIWLRATARGQHKLLLEYGGLSRGEDPRLASVLGDFAENHSTTIQLRTDTQKERHPRK